MAVYTISPDLIRNIEIDESVYFTDILFVFTQRTNTHKVASDKNGYVFNVYSSIQKNREIIMTWLTLMSFKPSPFEPIEIDIQTQQSEEFNFFKLCKATKGHNKIVLYSKQNLIEFDCPDGVVNFENQQILVLDKDDAKNELAPIKNAGDTYIGSQIARDNSQINKSKNN